MSIPEIDKVYKSKSNGRYYRVVLITNQTATKEDFPITVCYQDIYLMNNIYSVPLSVWNEKFIYEGS